jgi:hypothetical protein
MGIKKKFIESIKHFTQIAKLKCKDRKVNWVVKCCPIKVALKLLQRPNCISKLEQ